MQWWTPLSPRCASVPFWCFILFPISNTFVTLEACNRIANWKKDSARTQAHQLRDLQSKLGHQTLRPVWTYRNHCACLYITFQNAFEKRLHHLLFQPLTQTFITALLQAALTHEMRKYERDGLVDVSKSGPHVSCIADHLYFLECISSINRPDVVFMLILHLVTAFLIHFWEKPASCRSPNRRYYCMSSGQAFSCVRIKID